MRGTAIGLVAPSRVHSTSTQHCSSAANSVVTPTRLTSNASFNWVDLLQASLVQLVCCEQTLSDSSHISRRVVVLVPFPFGADRERYYWHSAASPGWPFPVLKYKYIFFR